ncbi:MAG: hypothetical protein AAB601_00790 [Patescibacteria group bacterium]
MKTAWIVAAEMGYGHLRAAVPLLSLAEGGRIVNADCYPGIPAHDERLWRDTEAVYHFVSRFREAGGSLGRFLFSLLDRFLRIRPIVPGADESRVTLQLRETYARIEHGWGKHLIEMLSSNPLPLIATFPIPAHMAECWRYPGPIYVVATDSDIARAWAPPHPRESPLHYFAPTPQAAEHLAIYGVSTSRITVTGFPLPVELVRAAEEHFTRRIERLEWKTHQPIVLTFAVGGAGAQSQLGAELCESVAPLVHANKVVLNLVAGTNAFVEMEFMDAVRHAGLGDELGRGVFVRFATTKDEYFPLFSRVFAETDILWTKPSELSFYAALGVPLLLAPPVGSQEDRNREWLLSLGAGMDALPASRAGRWLPELVESGALARAAARGFEKIERKGTENIMGIIRSL